MRALGIAGYSGAGKTTLIEQLLPRLRAHGLTVSVIKHTHHDFDIDRPGKDSFRHREAGAHEVIVGSGRRWALLHELRDEAEPGFEQLMARMAPCDLVLIEGFKHEAVAKIEVHRPSHGKPLLCGDDPHVIALATDAAFGGPAHRPSLQRLDLNQPDEIARFVLAWMQGPEAAPVRAGADLPE